MTENDYFEVTVKEAAHDDAGRGIARVSIEVMKKLGLVSGDVIEIQGKKKAAAIVWPGFAQDTGYGILRIDGNIRGNAGTGIDEKVRICKSEAEYAKKIVIQPTQPIRLVGGEQYLSRVLRGRSVIEGQTVRVDVIGNSITLVIAKVAPKGIAIVTDETEIELKEEPYKPEEGKQEALRYPLRGYRRSWARTPARPGDDRAPAPSPGDLRAARYPAPQGCAALRSARNR